MWSVSEGALGARASERVCVLARPRPPAVGWLPDRQPHAPVSVFAECVAIYCVCVCVGVCVCVCVCVLCVCVFKTD